MPEASTSPECAIDEMRAPTTTATHPGFTVDEFALTRVETGPDAESEFRNRLYDRAGATHCTGRAVEAREEAVASRVDLTSAKADELLPHKRVMALDQVTPARVTQLRACVLSDAGCMTRWWRRIA